MAIRFACPCGRAMAVKDELAGVRVRCPECKKPLTVPDGSVAVRAVPPPLRSPAPPEMKEDERPARRRVRREEEDEDDDDQPRRRRDEEEDDEPPKKKKKKKRVIESAPSGDSSPMVSVALGLLMMGGAVAWFVAGLFAGKIYIYPPILFISGIVTMVRGLTQ